MKTDILVRKMQKSCDEVSQILKALSHPQRLMILGHLLGGPKTVGDLLSLCGTSQSMMSQFLTRMKLEGLVSSEKDGKYQVYTLADKRLIQLMKTIQNEYCK